MTLAVIGGSGFVVDGALEPRRTPYGASSPTGFATVGGVRTLTQVRHGLEHELPPHRVPYRANLWALASLGATRVVALGAVGSLRGDWRVGDLVVCDQIVNRTWGRDDTFFDGPMVCHAVVSEPYCRALRTCLIEEARKGGMVPRDGGVLVVIQGPRYSTRAENRDWRALGYDVISMTHYPEVVLARELGLCFASAVIVTDHASVLGDDSAPSGSAGHDAVLSAFARSRSAVDRLVAGMARSDLSERACACPSALLRVPREGAFAGSAR